MGYRSFQVADGGSSSVVSAPMYAFTDFANRLKKVAKHRKSWASRVGTEAYRLYEMDIPEMRYIVDRYGDHIVVYDRRSGHIRDEQDDERDEDGNVDHTSHDTAIVKAAAEALGVPLANIHLKRRRRMPGVQQYEKLSEAGVKTIVREESSRYLINLTDYLDTGLFLDHRPMRSVMRKLPKGLSVLNLFCYTGSVSVAAAHSGARTTSVDMSNTYLDWAKENFKLNGFDLINHELVREDALKYLESGPRAKERFDVVFLDPPTFSNSKKMDQSFDVQRDHVRLVKQAMRFVKPDGVLYFSTNRQRFALDPLVTETFKVEDITAKTVPEDFRDKKIHRCFMVRQT